MLAAKECRRVVVTGLGMISPLGIGIEENWKNILIGQKNFQKLTNEGL